MKRWFRFSLKSEEADGQIATKVDETAAPEAEPALIPSAELPPAGDALSQLFVEAKPTLRDPAGPAAGEQSIGASSAYEASPIAKTLDELFPNVPDFRAAGRSSDEERPSWEAAAGEFEGRAGTRAPAIPSSELPSASHILAELFPAEQISIDHLGARKNAAPEPEQSLHAAEAQHTPANEPTQESGVPAASIALDPERQNEGASEASGPAEVDPEPPEQASKASTEIPGPAAPQNPRASYRDWAFDEKLAGHKEWVDSHGLSGKKGDFAGADLEGTELIGVNFRFADFHDANLKAADLLLADLRDACLVRADLQDACLVGANLEGANLEDASLETAMGLVPRQIAGANLRDASLPASFLEFPAAAALDRASRRVSHYFTAIMSASAISWLILWRTKDVQLVSDSSLILFWHSRAAAAALPTAESYLILPVALFILYLVFQFHLQKVWDAVLELPAVFPDGRAVGDRESGVVLALLRAHFHWIDHDRSSTRAVEKIVATTLAYWTVPATLLLFWARYLTRQEVRGTMLHALLVLAATGVAVYATTKTGRPAERWALERKWTDRLAAKLRQVNPATVACALGAVLLILSVGTIAGVPHSRSRAPQYSESSVRRWATTALWSIGFDPYADLTEASISTRPANWNGSDAQVPSVVGPRLNGARLRYAQAYGAFFVNAHLWHANMQGAYLSDADMRGVDLGESDLRFALMDHTQMSGANLDRAILDGADMRRANLQKANLSHTSLVGTTLIDADLEGATFYGSRLSSATLTRANFEKADFREAYLDKAEMEHADLRGAYLWSARLPDADLKGAQLGNAILIDAYLPNADLRWAQFAGTVLSGANLTGANLDGADMRGAGGLDANQVCSAKSRNGTLLDIALATQVTAQCGGGAISAPVAQPEGPATVAPAASTPGIASGKSRN
ncbi:MAG: pentapeptide repeat-containing protein [Candidatus Acidiferrales bacterium]